MRTHLPFTRPFSSRSGRRGDRTGRRAAAVAGTLLFAALVSGCGSGGGSGGASSDSGQNEAMRKYAQCMREQGVEMNDDGTTPGGGAGQTGTSTLNDAGNCSRFLDDAGMLPKKGDPEQRKQMLEMTKCLRENGVSVDDPADGNALQIPQDAPGLDEAMKKCKMGVAPKAGQ
ncbi:hypothetical protein ACTVZO_43725 [Streptomyces sp. IBSNAI002]|uniref:hypothetical protein n=1 Tax=Streptomyces sp. IBSNAI002 TaxID=3457500 RepID=UPI003FD32645